MVSDLPRGELCVLERAGMNSAEVVLAGVVSAWCVVETCAEIWPSLI
jgi:hypothetical protein